MDIADISYQAMFDVNQYYSTLVMHLHLSVAIHSSRMTEIRSSKQIYSTNKHALM
jgi:hypothetical protein